MFEIFFIVAGFLVFFFFALLIQRYEIREQRVRQTRRLAAEASRLRGQRIDQEFENLRRLLPRRKRRLNKTTIRLNLPALDMSEKETGHIVSILMKELKRAQENINRSVLPGFVEIFPWDFVEQADGSLALNPNKLEMIFNRKEE
jgi:hypothetical protein